MSKESIVFSGTVPRNQTLEQTPHRVLTFLLGVTNNKYIAEMLHRAGYTPAVNDQGWTLLKSCGGLGSDYEDSSNPAAHAIREVSDWCARSYERIEAALAHLHPEQRAYVFNSLAPLTGAASVVVVELLIDRLDDLAGTGKGAADRKAMAEEDKKALATLAARGFDDKEIKRVHDLVIAAHKIEEPAKTATKTVAMTQEQALNELKAWYDDWSTTAHNVIEKRADLIKLGLAKPRHAKAAPAEAPATPPATPVKPPEGPHA